MTQEGVRGAEYYKFVPKKGLPNPIHNCTLPFARNVVGPMDYTPTTFSATNKNTSYAHELALPVVYESGWTCMADKPEKYLDSPAKEFLQKLVATWDDIHFIAGYPGEYFVVARRNGRSWYLAGINAGPKRWVPIHFDFIKQGSCQVKVYRDNMEPTAVSDGELVHDMVTIEKGDRIRFLIEKNGGFAFIIENSY